MNENSASIECRNLWKVFGDAAPLRGVELPQGEGVHELTAALEEDGSIVACADINLSIRPGEFFVLMGLSGSGKSTLLRCMSRLTEPSAGQLRLEGEDFLAASAKELMEIRRRKMGMVFQHFGLFPHMTVLDNVAFPLRVQGMSLAQRHAKALEMIVLVGLEGREAAFPHELSGGQKQRVGIARSLAVDPQLWFLDEPFSALDPLIRWQMQSELCRLQTLFHKTIVFVTHDFMEAVRLADRIAIMKDGVVVQVGTPQEIVLSPANDYVAEFVKEAPRTRIIKVAQLMQPNSSATTPVPAAASGSDDSLHEDMLLEDMTLEDALSWSARRAGTLTVSDASVNTVGTITPQRLSAALSGDNLGD